MENRRRNEEKNSEKKEEEGGRGMIKITYREANFRYLLVSNRDV